MRLHNRLAVLFFLAILLAEAAPAAGQSLGWAKQAGGPCAFPCGIGFHQASAIAVDGAGNSVVTGHITGPVVFGRGELNETLLSSEGNSLFIARFDIHGSLLWARAVGGDLRGQAIAVDAAGNSYVAGSFRFGAAFPETLLIAPSPGVHDFFVAKYDPDGNFAWARQGGPDFIPGLSGGGVTAWGIAVDSVGNSRLTGGFGTPTGAAGFFVTRYDAGGSRDWVSIAMENAASPGGAAGVSVALDAAGNSYVVGNLAGTVTFGVDEPSQTTLIGHSLFVLDFFVAKYNPDGAFLWARGVGGDGSDEVTAIAADAAGNVHVTGMFHGAVTFGPGETSEVSFTADVGDMFLVKYDNDGAQQWVRHVPGPGIGAGAALAVDGSGNLHVTGGFVAFLRFAAGEANETIVSTEPFGSTNVFVAKYDGSGGLLWVRAATGNFAAVGRSVAADAAGGTYITGDFASLGLFGPSSLTFGHGEANETTLTTEGAGELFVARYTNDNGEPTNRRPIADAGADQTVDVGATVTLDGSGSSDPDLDPLTYEWVLVSKPPASGAALQNSTAVNPIFVADVAGTYQVALVVNDTHTSSAPDVVVVTTKNRPPIANAGADQSGTTGATIQLNGTGSSDPDGDALTFSWSLTATPAGSTAALTAPTAPSPSFVADRAGIYVAQLVVSDSQLASVPDTVSITVSDPGASVLACGSLVSGTIAAPGEVDLYSFTGQAGQIISLALASAGGFATSPSSGSVVLRVFAQSGAAIGGALSSNSQNLYTLPIDGVYTIRVNANNPARTGSYNISRECLFPIPSPDAVPLPCGGLAAGTLDVPGDTDLFTLTGAAGQIISLALASASGFSTSPSSGSVVMTLFAPSGAAVGTLASNSQSLFTLPATGVYAIRVSANNLARTGAYNISRECLFPIQSPDAVPLPCSGFASGSIDVPGDSDLFTFTGAAGQIISLALANAGGFSTSPSSGSVAMTLFAPSGAAVGTLASNSQSLFTLPATGVYAIRVSANNLARTGAYNIGRECLFPIPSPDPVPLPCGGLAAGTLDAPGDTDLFTLTGAAGEIISLALASTDGFSTSPSSGSVVMTLFAPSGAVVGALASNSQSLFTLPTTGVYAIRVSANNLARTGAYNISRECLFPVPSPDAVPLPCGDLAAGTINVPGDTDLFTLTGPPGQIISLALASTAGFATRPGSRSVVLTVFASSGAAVGGTLASNSQSLYTLPIDGVVAIRVSANNLATTGSYSVRRTCQ